MNKSVYIYSPMNMKDSNILKAEFYILKVADTDYQTHIFKINSDKTINKSENQDEIFSSFGSRNI